MRDKTGGMTKTSPSPNPLRRSPAHKRTAKKPADALPLPSPSAKVLVRDQSGAVVEYERAMPGAPPPVTEAQKVQRTFKDVAVEAKRRSAELRSQLEDAKQAAMMKVAKELGPHSEEFERKAAALRVRLAEGIGSIRRAEKMEIRSTMQGLGDQYNSVINKWRAECDDELKAATTKHRELLLDAEAHVQRLRDGAESDYVGQMRKLKAWQESAEGEIRAAEKVAVLKDLEPATG